MIGGLQMKLPVWRHPTLFALLLILLIVLAGTHIAQGDTPLQYPSGLVALLAGLLGGALLMLSGELEERLGGEQYLRRILEGRRSRMPRPYWWVGVLAMVLFWVGEGFVKGTGDYAAGWYWFGGLWGLLAVGYPLMRAQWKRLERLLERETSAATDMTG